MSEPRENHAGTAATAAVLVVALATALKLTTIYAAAHPRVLAAVEGLLALVRSSGATVTLLLKEQTFHVGREQVAASDARLLWLAARLRAATLRGVEIDLDCTTDEVLQFAAFVRERCRPGAATSELSLPHLRALPLLFAGHHSEHAGADANAVPEATPATAAGLALSPAVAGALADIRESPSYRDQVSRLAASSASTGDGDHRVVDLLQVIGKMLPAEIANDPEQIPQVVGRVLDVLESEMQDLADGKRTLRGGRLLLRAVAVARSFFGSAPPTKPAAPSMPTGRPEDANIAAKLENLLDEQDSLPRDDRPLGALLVHATGETLEHELLGVCLHLAADSGARRSTSARLTALLRDHARARIDLLDAHLAGAGAQRLGAAGRLHLLRLLADAGHGALARERRYVDDELISKGFPESLAVAASMLGSDPDSLLVLRRALAALTRTIAAGGASAAVRSGVLAEPAVLRSLLAAGGAEAERLLLAAHDGSSRATRAVFVEFLRQQALPAPVLLVLQIHPTADALTTNYVRELHTAFVQQRYGPALRTATDELLRNALELDRLTAAERVAAIGHLHLVPDRATQLLLERLATFGRFRPWDVGARAVRRAARKALTDLHTHSRS